jgi:hypothetical protein
MDHAPTDASEPALTGGCLCGGVRYEIDAPLLGAGYCHCTRCQRRTGTAASANGTVAPGAFRVTQGEQLVRAWQPPDGWAKCFCSVCGSALFSRDPDDPSHVGVRLGTLDGDPGVRPSARKHVASAAVWEPIPDDGLPRRPGH